jgi:hypothetical protein
VRVAVENAQVVQYLREIGAIGGRVLSRELAPEGRILPEDGLGLVEPVCVPVENA